MTAYTATIDTKLFAHIQRTTGPEFPPQTSARRKLAPPAPSPEQMKLMKRLLDEHNKKKEKKKPQTEYPDDSTESEDESDDDNERPGTKPANQSRTKNNSTPGTTAMLVMNKYDNRSRD